MFNLLPPAATSPTAGGNKFVDAEVLQEQKPLRVAAQLSVLIVMAHFSPQLTRGHVFGRPETPLHELQYRAQQNVALVILQGSILVLLHYFTDPVATASQVSTRACNILRNRPVTCLVTQKYMVPSPLTATVLSRIVLLHPKDLEVLVIVQRFDVQL